MGNMNQKEIGEEFNLDDSTISDILGNMKNHITQILEIGSKSGKSFDKMATENNLHPLTPYIAHLEDKINMI